MIHPESRFNLFREAFVLLLTIIVAIQAPIMIVFDIQLIGFIAIFDILVTLVFAVDIVLNFFTGYEDGNEIIMDRKLIAGRYLRGWFWIDFLATVPLASIFHGISSTWFSRIPKMLRLVRLTRLLRLLRLLRLIRIAQTMSRINSTNQLNPSILRLDRDAG